MPIIERKCNNCGKEYKAKSSDIDRGWGLCCCKSCASSFREKSKPNYNTDRVSKNNYKRALYSHLYDDYIHIKPYDYEGLSHEGADDDQWGDCDFGIHE